MRISTNQIYDSGSAAISRNQSELYKLQNQLSSGRRILTPSDDPVASARALVLTQSQQVNAQYVENQGVASSQLGLVDAQISSLTDLLQSVRERAVQAGNTILSNTDRQAIATELESRLSELMGIANSQNGAGDYLFSGYQGAARPFALSTSAPVAPATTPPVAYSGDDGQRLLQVSASRQLAVNVAGSDLFMNAKIGNGAFATASSGNYSGAAVYNGFNTGIATIDAGTVVDQQKWLSAINSYPWSDPNNPDLQLRFTVPGATTPYEYQLFDVSVPGAPVSLTAGPPFPSYTPGQTIPLATTTAPVTDFGAQVVVYGQPLDGDTFSVAPASNQSIFQTMQSLIGILKQPLGTTAYSNTEYTSALGSQLTNLDQALANVSRVQSTVGTSLRELESLGSNASALDLQYQSSLSDLQDLDYAAAISDFTLRQVTLDAAQKSFVKISGLSLFSYL
jgi:flagellar hook-associated protein 3 FlgL